MLDELYAFLAKIGFNEPLHSPVTHMPIGLVAGALIFFIVAIIFKRNSLVLTARHASILAFIFAFPTIMLGVMDWIHFYHAALFVPIIIKMVLASAALVILGAGIILGSEIKLHSVTHTVLYAAAFVVMIGLGYFGSGIVYGRGLQVKVTGAAIGEVPNAPADTGRAARPAVNGDTASRNSAKRQPAGSR